MAIHTIVRALCPLECALRRAHMDFLIFFLACVYRSIYIIVALCLHESAERKKMKKAEPQGEHTKTVEEKDKYHNFIGKLNKEEKREFLKISRWALRHIINEKNKKIQREAIISISKALKTGKHPITGRYIEKKLTQLDIKAVLNKIRDEIRIDSITKEIVRTGRIGVDIGWHFNKYDYKYVLYLPSGRIRRRKTSVSAINTELCPSDNLNKIFNKVKKRFGEVITKSSKNRCERLSFLESFYFLITNPQKFKEFFKNYDPLIFYCDSRVLKIINVQAKKEPRIINGRRVGVGVPRIEYLEMMRTRWIPEELSKMLDLSLPVIYKMLDGIYPIRDCYRM